MIFRVNGRNFYVRTSMDDSHKIKISPNGEDVAVAEMDPTGIITISYKDTERYDTVKCDKVMTGSVMDKIVHKVDKFLRGGNTRIKTKRSTADSLLLMLLILKRTPTVGEVTAITKHDGVYVSWEWLKNGSKLHQSETWTINDHSNVEAILKCCGIHHAPLTLKDLMV